jgi:hypothetical protein
MRYNEDYSVKGDYVPQDPGNHAYFNAALRNGVRLCIYLCIKYDITPANILSHAEGYQQGIASNHSDPTHWWSLHGVTMDVFRNLVERGLAGENVAFNYGPLAGGDPVQVVDEIVEHEDPARVVDEFLERGDPAQLDDEF